MIEAITFDYWNTLVWERPGQLVEDRLKAWRRILAETGIAVADANLATAHAKAFAEYQAAWRANRQYVVVDATNCILRALELDVTPDAREALVTSFTIAGASTALQLADGVAHCLLRLRSSAVRLGIVCDVGLTPSPVLLEHLDRWDLLSLFDTWAFSDTVGVYKPGPAIFRAALDELGVSPHAAAHVGDRLRTDVGGAHDLGMATIRYSGIYEDPEQGLAEADVVVADYASFPSVEAIPLHR